MHARTLLLTILIATTHAAAATWFVDAARPTDGPGTSWQQAFRTIQPAIDAAHAAGGGEVWVAGGIYGELRPDSETGSLVLRPGVAVYGGFAGTEFVRDSRNVTGNPTVIDGTFSKQGGPANHVVVSANDARLDGFELRLAPASPLLSGGGVLARGTAPVIANCLFTGFEGFLGAALLADAGGAPVLADCRFEGNQGLGGAAIAVVDASLQASGLVFVGNASPLGYGGAVYAEHSVLTLLDATFDGNTAGLGGAIYLTDSNATLLGVTFTGNHATDLGGAIAAEGGAGVTVHNAWFEGNQAAFGGAVGLDDASHAAVTNGVFWRNAAEIGGAFYTGVGSTLDLRSSTVTANAAADFGGGLVAAGSALATAVNTIIYANGVFDVFSPAPEALVISFSIVGAGLSGESILLTDPGFADPESGDFQLQADSPAINAGTLAGAPPHDFNGFHRPSGAGVDIGAFEFDLGPPIDPGDGDGDGDGDPTEPETTVLFVARASTAPQPDGLSWQTAFPTLQAALDAAAALEITEVWVAAGLYDESRSAPRVVFGEGTATPIVANTGALVLRDGVRVYGGFAGHEVQRWRRDPQLNATIIDGATARNGQPAWHVILAAEGARLDGFTVRGGRARNDIVLGGQHLGSFGAGLQGIGVSMRIVNCVFEDNRARFDGGAVYLRDSDSRILRSTFRNNAAGRGGALFLDGATILLEQVTLSGNEAESGAGACILDSAVSASNVRAENNRAHDLFGSPQAGSGGSLYLDSSHLTAAGLDLIANSASAGAGAISIDSSIAVSGGDWSGNTATGDGGAWLAVRSTLALDGVTARGNAAMNGAVLDASDTTLTVSEAAFTGNSAAGAGGALLLTGGPSAAIADAVFTTNAATTGGAVHRALGGVRIDRTRFHGNQAQTGGALSLVSSEAELFTIAFTRNTASRQGAAINLDAASTAIVAQSTVAANEVHRPDWAGAAIESAYTSGVALDIFGSIFWNNTPDSLLVAPSAAVEAAYTISQGEPIEGEGNSNGDPLLINPRQGNVRLKAASPAIAAAPRFGDIETDINGIALPEDGPIDLGVHQLIDIDGDGMPDDWEAEVGLDPTTPDGHLDASGNGFTNRMEYELGTDPWSAADPPSRVHVDAQAGSDSAGLGTAGAPWRTVGHALAEIAHLTGDFNPMTVSVAQGIYAESVALPSYTILEGSGPMTIFQHQSIGPGATRPATITMAAHTVLRDLLVRRQFNALGEHTLVRIESDSFIRLRSVQFDGLSHPQSTGLVVLGSGNATGIVRACRFSGLRHALLLHDTGITVTRCLFASSAEAVRIEGAIPPAAALLGLATMPATTGLNRFSGSGLAVANLTGVSAAAQFNAWNTIEPGEIEARLEGDVVYQPFLGQLPAPQSFIITTEFEGGLPGGVSPTFRVDGEVVEANFNAAFGAYVLEGIEAGQRVLHVEAEGFTAGILLLTMTTDDLVWSQAHVTIGPNPDVDGNGVVDAVDVQLVINGALGVSGDPRLDVNRDGRIDALDVQIMINAALA